MSILAIVLILCVFVVCFYLIHNYGPGEPIRLIFLVVLGIILILWLLRVTGLLGEFGGTQI